MITPPSSIQQQHLVDTGRPRQMNRTGETRVSLYCSYLTSTVAPASVNFFLMFSASSLDTPSFTVLGAPSTRSLASFKPRLVTSRTALITLILFAPTSLRTTANSVFSSAGAAAAPAPAPPPATITGAAAAAETPRRSSSFLTSCAASSSDSPTICSSNCAKSAIFSSPVFELSVFFVTLLQFVTGASFQCFWSSSLRQTTPRFQTAVTLDLITKPSLSLRRRQAAEGSMHFKD